MAKNTAPPSELREIRDYIMAEYRDWRAQLAKAREATNAVAAMGAAPTEAAALGNFLLTQTRAKDFAKAEYDKAEEGRPNIEALFVGVRVVYWFPRATGCQPGAATVDGIARDGKLNMMVTKDPYQHVTRRCGIEYSETPKAGTWSFMANGLL